MIAMFLAFRLIGTLNYTGINDAGRGTTISRHGRHGHRADAVRRRLRQVRPAAAVHLAARRHGRPHPGVGADPRRHDGHRGRVPDDPDQPARSRSPRRGRRRSIAIVGVRTALFAATIAVAQNDIKKVLAYSTVSQLGYMFLAVGSGAYVAAIFHMVTHAFFKALLFLGSGSVIHGMHDEQDMRRMGALRKLCRSRRPRSSSAGWPSPACRRSPASGRRTRSCCSPSTRARSCGSSASSPRCSPRST